MPVQPLLHAALPSKGLGCGPVGVGGRVVAVCTRAQLQQCCQLDGHGLSGIIWRQSAAKGLSTGSVICHTPGQVWYGGGVGRRLTPPPPPFSEVHPHAPVLLGPLALRLLGDVNSRMHRAVLGGRLASARHSA